MAKNNVVARDVKQDKLNYLIFEFKSFLERNQVDDVTWVENSLSFGSKDSFSKAVEAYEANKSHWNSFIKHDLSFNADEQLFAFAVPKPKENNAE